MIEIEVRPVGDHVLYDLSASTITLVAKSVKNQLANKTRGMVCNYHPTVKHSIVILHDNKTLKIEEPAYCCEEFQSKIKSLVKSFNI